MKAAAFTGGEADFAEMPPLIDGSPDFGHGVMQSLSWALVALCALFVIVGLKGIFGVIKAYYF